MSSTPPDEPWDRPPPPPPGGQYPPPPGGGYPPPPPGAGYPPPPPGAGYPPPPPGGGYPGGGYPGGGYPGGGYGPGPGSKGWTQYGPATGWWRRVGATVIDLLVLLIPTFIVTALAGVVVGQIIDLALTAGYLVYMQSQRGQTVGNMAVSTRVVDVATGGRPSVQKALLRWAFDGVIGLLAAIGRINHLGGLSLLFFLVILLDYLWPLWDQQNQTLHDKIAGTFVIQNFN